MRLLTFSLCASAPKTCQQQTCLGRYSTSKPRSSCPSMSVAPMEDDVMVIATMSSICREGKNSPAHLRLGRGERETKISVQGRVGAGFPCSTGWESTSCRDHAPFSAQPLHLPQQRIKISATWRLWLHFCNFIPPDSVQVHRTVGVERGLWGSPGPKVALCSCANVICVNTFTPNCARYTETLESSFVY